MRIDYQSSTNDFYPTYINSWVFGRLPNVAGGADKRTKQTPGKIEYRKPRALDRLSMAGQRSSYQTRQPEQEMGEQRHWIQKET